MANGHRFNMFDPTTVAHKSFPFGTKLRLTNPKTGKSIRVVVRDRGPYIRGRQLDLSFAAAKVLGFVSSGTAALKVERLN
jgi:rare lipoprotein A